MIAAALAERQDACDQGGLRRPQRESTGCARRWVAVRKAIDAAGHPALLLVDTISSLASIHYRHDEWGVDVTVAGSQKGLMLPPGLVLHYCIRQGDARQQHAKLLCAYLGLAARCSKPNVAGLLPLDAVDQPPLWPPRRPSPCCTRRGSTTSSPP